jgi:phosphatidylinositol glycan class B
LTKNIKIGLIFSFCLFLVTAYYSEGFFHPDEHFQLIEFANYKIGKTSLNELPWEFESRIRPALQVSIGYFLLETFNYLGLNDPFKQLTILRIITAILSWLVISRLFLLLIKNFKNEKTKHLLLFASFFIWFIPFLSVRFSSENYASITMLAGIFFNLKSPQQKTSQIYYNLIAGLLLGLSFFFRFQMAFSIAGIGLWLLIVKKETWKNLTYMISGGAIALLLCLSLDYWLYGSFEFTPYNYYTANISLNLAAEWGTMPWWFYLNAYILSCIPPLSIILLILFAWGVYTKPSSIFVWIIIPFLLAHFLVGHKELRFLFPMIFCFTCVAVNGYDSLMNKFTFSKTLKIVTTFILVLNTPILIVKAITPAQEAVSYFRYLYELGNHQKVVIICPEKSVYDISGVVANFYKNENISVFVATEENSVNECLNELNAHKMLVLNRNIMKDESYPGYKMKHLYCAYPKWIKQINFFNWISRSRIWQIVEVEKLKVKS